MWKLLWFFFVSAFSQYIAKDGVRDKLAEQNMLENIKPMLDIYISDSLERHKSSLLEVCEEIISDSAKQIETKIEQFLRATTTTPAPRVCDQGWITSPEKCYYVSTTSEKTEWSWATERCTAKGANLVEIQTDEEASFISRNMPSRVSYSDFIYTGRKRTHRETPTCECRRQSDDFQMQDCLCTGFKLLYICEIVR